MKKSQIKNELDILNIFHTEGHMYSDNLGENRHNVTGDKDIRMVMEVLTQVNNFMYDAKVIIEEDKELEMTLYYIVEDGVKTLIMPGDGYINIEYVNSKFSGITIRYEDWNCGWLDYQIN